MDLRRLPKPARGITVLNIILLILLIGSSIFLLGVINLPMVQQDIPSTSIRLTLRIGIILLITVYVLNLALRERQHTTYKDSIIQALDELNVRLGTILRVARRLGSRLDYDELLRDIVNEAAPVTRASLGAVYLLDRSSKTMELRHTSGVDRDKMMFKEIPLIEGILADAANRKRVVAIDNLNEVDERENLFFGAVNPGSQVVIPLWAGEKLTGMLVTATMEPHAYSRKEVGILTSVAEVAGMALTNAELYDIASRSVKALVRRRELAGAILEEIKAGVITADVEGKINLFNKEAERITGFSFSEKVGKVLKPEPSPMLNPLGPIEAGMLEAAKSDTPVVRGEAFITNSRNLSVPVTYGCYSLMDDSGRIMGCAAVFMEIQGAALRMPEDMGGGGKLLLNSLVTRVEKMYSMPFQEVLSKYSRMEPRRWMEAQKGVLDVLEAGYATLQHLVEDVKGYTAIDEIVEGEVEESVDLRELVGRIVQELLTCPAYRQVDVRLELNEISPAYGYTRLARIAIEKVVENSLAAAAKDSNRVEITGTTKEGTVVVSVHNFGRGVSKELEDYIFAPFFTTSDSGSGLGLSIVANAMRNLGGKVWFESSPDSGAIFYLEFPVAGSGGESRGS